MTPPVPIITGIGLVTPLGNNVPETWNALLAGRFIRTHSRCSLDGTSPDRVHKLAIAAAGEAVADARWSTDAGHAGDAGDAEGGVALVVGTSKGAIETCMPPMTAPPAVRFLDSIALAVRAGFPLLDGPSLTLSAACASGTHALIRAAMMIRAGEAKRVLVVAAEASVHPLFLGSFKRLGVLPRDEIGCRPFDVDRDGFLMSEAAAAVCLEASESQSEGELARPRAGFTAHRPEDGTALPGYASVERFALAGDGTHMTAGDPDGSTLRHIIRAAVLDRPIDLIHAHGTGTVFNDPVELAAFEAECTLKGEDGSTIPAVYSHKGALGHSLGASGLVSVALSCRMHREQFIPPNVQTRTALPGPIIGVMLSSDKELRQNMVGIIGPENKGSESARNDLLKKKCQWVSNGPFAAKYRCSIVPPMPTLLAPISSVFRFPPADRPLVLVPPVRRSLVVCAGFGGALGAVVLSSVS